MMNAARFLGRRRLLTIGAGLLLGMSSAGESPAIAADPTTASTRPTLRVLSYNIHHAEGVDGKLDVVRIAGIIRDCQADVVAVQEVDKGATRSKRGDQPAELAKLTGLTHHFFGKTIDLQGGEYGNLILSRYPITDTRIHPLPNTAKAEPRNVIEAEIAPPGAEKFRLFATHFDFGGKEANEADRQEGIRMVNERAAATKQAALFAGDFNSTPSSRTIKAIRETWGQTSSEESFTIPVDRPTKQIDFIFTRPAERWKVVESKVIDEKIASDHLPIFAVLELTPSEAGK